MVSADVKANIKQQQLKDLVTVSYKFLSEVPSKLAILYKKGLLLILKITHFMEYVGP